MDDLTLGNGDGTVGKALEVLDRVAAIGRPVRFAELLDNLALSQGHAVPAAADADLAGDAGL